MQENTLEELYWSIHPKDSDELTMARHKAFLARCNDFISSREEKVREEGRREAYKEILNTPLFEKLKKVAVTQYKEELLKSLPEENSIYEIDRMMVNDNKYIAGKFVGFNECLSTVKKLFT